MLSGFNTNVRYRGLLLHVQTEDSGRANPHVITHLYHGGTILASERSQYGDRLDSGSLATEVRALMEEQHRRMLRSLKRGELDARLMERLGRDAFPDETGAATASEGGGATLPGATAPAAAAGDEALRAASDPATGARLAAAADERPLDELVLDYLVERAARRQRSVP